MEYKGKLYGKIGNEYFDTGKTSNDWDEMIDALISVLNDVNDKDNIMGEISSKSHEKIINALEKAGCTYE